MFKKNNVNSNVKVSLGGTALNMSDKVIEAEMKIMEYRNTIVNQSEKIKFLENDKENLNLEIEENKKEIEKLRKEIRIKNEENFEEKNKSENFCKENLLNEKKLKESQGIINLQSIEINELNFRLSEYEKNNMRFNKEIIESEKIKDLFEKDVVNLHDSNIKMNDKIRMLEHVLAQRDKYIQILLKRKDGKNENFEKEKNKKFEVEKRDSMFFLYVIIYNKVRSANGLRSKSKCIISKNEVFLFYFF